MAETLVAKDPLQSLAATGQAVRILSQPGLGLATVLARRGAEAKLEAKVRKAYGIELPAGPKSAHAGGLTFVGTAPGVWMAIQEGGRDSLADKLAADLAGLASVSDQSGGYATVRVSGPKARAALAKKLILDLHPSAFGPGDAAVTNFGLINGLLIQLDDSPTYDLAVFRSYAEDVWRALAHDSAEFNAPG